MAFVYSCKMSQCGRNTEEDKEMKVRFQAFISLSSQQLRLGKDRII